MFHVKLGAPAPPAPPMTAAEFQALTGAAPTPIERIEEVLTLLRLWQPRMNLVGRSTLEDPWRRHVLDSAQLMAHAGPDARVWLDIGSGAGFPGLITAIIGASEQHLVESNTRKCAFLREAARVAGIDVHIHNGRAEDIVPIGADVVTARAVAPLAVLLPLAARHLAQRGTCLFLKSQEVDTELTEATKYWKLRTTRFASLTDSGGCILRLEVEGHE